MSRTLLYYPTFRIPSRQWLADGVLYWDHVSSIVPRRLQRVVDRPDLRYLADEGIYEPLDPEPTLKRGHLSDDFAADFAQRLDSPQFSEELGRPGSTQDWDVAFEKVSRPCWEALVERDLTLDKQSMNGWVRVRKPAAIIYMGLLADYLASQAQGLVQTSTDQAEYEETVYRSKATSPPVCGLALTLKNLLPCVAQNTELREIVEFRSQRRDELLRLRNEVDELQLKLHKCEGEQEAEHLIEQFKDRAEVGLNDVRRTMEENGLRMVVGSLRAVFSSKSPAWLAATAGGVGAMVGGPPLALVTSGCGFVAGAAIELARFGLEMRDRTRAAQERPFSYLYSAEKCGIT